MSKEGQYHRWYSVKEHLPSMTILNHEYWNESPRLPVMVEGLDELKFAVYREFHSTGDKVWDIEFCTGDWKVTHWFPLYVASEIPMTINEVTEETTNVDR